MASNLPETGKWIQFKIGDRDFTCKVGNYDQLEAQRLNHTGFHQYYEKNVEIKYMDGTDDSIDVDELESYNWSYVEVPSDKNLQIAVVQRDNLQRQISCAYCKSNTMELKSCKACHNVYYCDKECQTNDWKTHTKDCFHEKVKRKPDPRYPMAQIRNEIRLGQRVLQAEFHNILLDALNGRFETMHVQGPFFPSSNPDIGRWVRNPKPTDLEALERYQIKQDSSRTDHQDPIVFKWRGLESIDHGKGEPIACSLIKNMECWLADDERYKEGGLHYLAGNLEDSGVFWAMVMNFNTFGTVAPFHTDCHCNVSRLPKKQRKLISKWGKILKRAKEDEFDIQCMFSETPVGCHNFADCPFKHEIEYTNR